jgi:hypothetical protein
MYQLLVDPRGLVRIYLLCTEDPFTMVKIARGNGSRIVIVDVKTKPIAWIIGYKSRQLVQSSRQWGINARSRHHTYDKQQYC